MCSVHEPQCSARAEEPLEILGEEGALGLGNGHSSLLEASSRDFTDHIIFYEHPKVNARLGGRPLLARSHFQALWISPSPWRSSPVGRGGRVFLGGELRVASSLSSRVDCGSLFSNRACLEHRCWESLNP